MAVILKQYKLPNGAVDFPKIFDVPVVDRITALAARDFSQTNMLIIAALTMAFEAMNMKRGLNEFQILNLAEEIIDTASEDHLSMEDLMLFLQNLVRGKYKMSYETFDIPKFMALFDAYRQERWDEGVKLREEKVLQWKGLGDADRISKGDALADHFSKLGGSLHELKRAMLDQKRENEVVKKADKYYGT